MNNQIEEIISNRKSKIVKFGLIVAVVISIIGLLIDLRNTLTYPGTDLRNRVVGARLMLEGIDPYFFKWQPGLSERFYDPLDIPTELLSKLSVPPTVLALHSVIAQLSYLQQKLIWLIVQWAALIGTVFIFIKSSNSRPKTNLTIAISFLFVNSLFWRFHVNSGQIYIVYVFLLAMSWFLLNQLSKYNNLLSGFLVGVTTSFRPTFILFFLPFVISQKYSFLIGGFLGLLFSISLSCTVAGIFIWKKYLLSMLGMTGIIDLNTYLPVRERIKPAADIVYPKTIEGFDPAIRNPLEYYLDNTSLYDVLNALDIPNKRNILAFGFIITMIFLCVWIYKYFSKTQNINHLFLLGNLICLIGDFFIPVGRYSYYDIQMLLPLLIIINQMDIKYLTDYKSTVVIISGLLLSVVGFLVIPRALFFSVFIIMSYIIYISMFVTVQDNKAKRESWQV